MDIEQVVTTFDRAAMWLGPALNAISAALIPKELLAAQQRVLEKTPYAYMMSSDARKDFQETAEKKNMLIYVHQVGISLAALRSYPVDDVEKLVGKLAVHFQKPEDFEKEKATKLKVGGFIFGLGMSAKFAQRDARIVELFGPLYEKLNDESAEERKLVASTPALKFFEGFQGYATKNNAYRVRLGWALGTADDEQKRILGYPITETKFSTDARYSWNIIEFMGGLLKGNHDQVAEVQKRLSIADKKREEQSRRVQELEKQLADAHIRLAQAPPKSLADDYAKLKGVHQKLSEDHAGREKGYRRLKEEHDAFLETFAPEITKLKSELVIARQQNQALENKLAAQQKKDDFKVLPSIANGTGITVFVGKDVYRRYAELAAYQHPLNGEPFLKVVDKHIGMMCRIIKDQGRSAERKPFSFAEEVRAHMYKTNDETRIFFSTDWEKKLTIHDITTPAEHNTGAAKTEGRYANLLGGRALLARAEEGVRQIVSSLDEVKDFVWT